MKKRGSILVVDDHRLFADAISSVLGGLERGLRVVACGSAEEALGVLAGGTHPELILLDLGLPKLRGLDAFRALAAQTPGVPIVIVTAAEPNAEMHRILREGARGVVHKRASAIELLSVLRFVLAGGTHVPAELLSVPATGDDEGELTARQREVLVLLAGGASNKDIADRLGIAEATVRVHVSSVLRVLGVENRTQAATSALARRLLGS